MVVTGGSPRGRIRRLPGFTLIELLTVMAIIAILAGVIIGTGRRATERGKVARAHAELAVLATALEAYRRFYGDYPQTEDGARWLQSLLGRRSPTNASIADRPLLDAARFTFSRPGDPVADASVQLLDPWGQPYVYVYKVPVSGWVNSSPVLYSTGPNGRSELRLAAGGFPSAVEAAPADDVFPNP